MACNCKCNCKIKLDDITDPVVRKEITEIQKHIDDAICSQLNSVKVSDTYMTDMNYSPEGDIEQRLNLEIEARQLGDEALQNQIDNEVEARQVAIDEAFANVQILVDNEATIRAEEDKKLSNRIDDIESGNLEYIDEKIAESIDSVEYDIETIQHWIDIHGGDWEEAVRREQARAMGVEENLQAQIYNKQDTLISGENIKTINNVSILGSGNIDVGGGTGTSDYEQLNNKPSIENITLVGNKTAEDLGLAKSSDLEGKQDIIEDLDEIRSGAEAGSTAVQPSAISDMETKTHAEETYAEKSELDNKQDTLVSGTNIKTINNTSLLGEGNISISGSVVTPAGEASIFDDSQPKNLFGKTSVQEEVWESIHVLKSDEQSDFSLDSNNTTTMGVFTQTDQRAIQEKRLDSFRIYVSNTDWNGSIQFYLANIGGTGLLNDTLWPLNSSMNVATYMSKSAPLFKFTPTSEDAGKKCVVKLDGSDTRVSEINQDYVDETGHIYIPMGHYISVKNPNVVENCLWKYSGMTGSFAGFYFINEIPASNPNGGKGIYSTEQLGIGWDIAEVETVTIEKETFDYYFVEDPDAKVEKLVKENFTFSNLGEDYGSFYVFQDCSELNDKYFTSVSYYPIANQTCKFCYLIVPDNSQVSISDANIDVANLVAGNRVLFTITPDSGSSSAERPQKFALDGSDPRVTIVATDLYDAEVGGFLWNSTMTFGFDGRKASGKSMYYSPVEVEGGSQRFVAASPNATTFNQLTNEQLGFGLYAKADSKIRVHSDIIQQALDDIEDLKQGGGSDVSPLKGKTISFVGDSITTFSGITNVDPLPTNAAVWYPHNSVTNVDQTYWKKLIDRTGVELLVNNAWSGSHVTNRTRGDICNYDYQADSGSGTSTVKDRCTHLHRTEGGLIRNPDYIVINMGTNDFDNMNSTYTMGTWNGRGEKFPDITAKPTNFREAYAVMLRRITTTYPLAKVFCCTVPCGNVRGDGLNEVNAVGVYLVEFNDAIREIATAFGCRVIELATSGLNYNTLSTLYEDGNLHPNEAGMERYYEIIRQALEDGDTTNVSCPRNTAVMKGTPTTVSNATSTDDVVAQFNTLLSVLRDRGVIAS